MSQQPAQQPAVVTRRRALRIPLVAVAALALALPAFAKPRKDNPDAGGIWDLRALEQTHEIIKTTRDATAEKVTWLLEKRVDGYLSYEVAFYDADDVKLTTAYITFEPAGVAK